MGAGWREDSSEGMKMVAGRGSRGGKKLWRCEVRPHLNPLPGGEEVASLCNPYPTPTPAGDKPLASRSLRPRYIFSFRHRPSVYNSARFAGGEPASRLIGGHIPDRSPGHAFVLIVHAGWRRHTKL